MLTACDTLADICNACLTWPRSQDDPRNSSAVRPSPASAYFRESSAIEDVVQRRRTAIGELDQDAFDEGKATERFISVRLVDRVRRRPSLKVYATCSLGAPKSACTSLAFMPTATRRSFGHGRTSSIRSLGSGASGSAKPRMSAGNDVPTFLDTTRASIKKMLFGSRFGIPPASQCNGNAARSGIGDRQCWSTDLEWHECCLATCARPWAIPPILEAAPVGGLFVFLPSTTRNAQCGRRWLAKCGLPRRGLALPGP
jgi:hypothetical protein